MYDRKYIGGDIEPMEDLLKPQDISRKLKISRSFTYRLLKSGELPSVHLRNTYRVRPRDLIDFIERNLRCQENKPQVHRQRICNG
jgi:excisionase family DNA binding protein